MKLNAKQKIVLAGVLRSQRALAGMDYHAADYATSIRRGQYRLAIVRARDGAVPINLEGWLGRQPTASDRVMYCRELDRLEIMGLLRRLNFYTDRRTMRRASHVRLTATGLEVAERLLAEERADAGNQTAARKTESSSRVERADDLAEPIDVDGIDWSSITALIEAPADQPV
ncbi:MAG: hypothetical protein BIFFINMI_03297 [Phycisphaerae bacterium]|nr:hypothetical protein [Phycisphaerae bacterium]